MSFNTLTGYKPEQIEENDFECISGKNIPCKVNFSRIEDVEAGDGYEGYKRLKYELEVMDGKYTKRKLWKSFNLDSDKAAGKEGKQKTPIQRLADLFFTLGLGEFSNIEQLHSLNDKFAELSLSVSCNKIPADKSRDGKEVQLHTITGVLNSTGSSSSSSSTKPSF